MYDLKNDIFEPVAKRISERVSSLSEIRRLCTKSGIEGWLKVEAVKALSGMVESINREGPDLTLKDNTQIELKAMTNFDAAYIRNGCLWKHRKKYKSGRRYDDAPCLFLADGSNLKKVKNIGKNGKVKVGPSQIINAKSGSWIVGLAVPNLGKFGL